MAPMISPPATNGSPPARVKNLAGSAELVDQCLLEGNVVITLPDLRVACSQLVHQ